MVFRDYKETPEQAAEYLRLTLAAIAKYELPATPINYSLFYERAAGQNQLVRTRLDELLEQPEPPSQAALNRLYRNLLIQDETSLQQMRRELHDIVQAMSEEIIGAGGRFTHYGTVLRDFAEILGGTSQSEKLKSTVDQVIDETDLTEHSRRALEERLGQVLREVDELKGNLEQIREEALTDALTGVPNRKAFNAALDRAMLTARQDETPLSIVLIDIDRFKQFNDNHGHLIGDKVLRYVAAKIRQCLKGKDFPSRFGGEEFALLLPTTELRGAEAVAEEVRNAVSSGELKIRGSGERLGKITVSAGIAQLRNTDTATDLIRRVDAALYRAKNRGRDRVEREAP